MANDDQLLLAPVGTADEFGPRTDQPGKKWNGTCGQESLATCLSVALGKPSDKAHLQGLMNALALDMIRRGIAASNGAATLAALATEARNYAGNGIVYKQYNYQEPLPWPLWRDELRASGRVRPIVLQVANGKALVDSQSGARDEATLQYHAIAVVGKSESKGYICADPDNPLADQRFVYYTLDTLIAARPCGMLILNMARPAITITPAPLSGNVDGLPGWHDDGHIITAPNGHTATAGFRQWILDHKSQVQFMGDLIDNGNAVPYVGNDPAHGPGSEQLFNCGGIYWQESNNAINQLWVGALLQQARQQLAAAQAQNASQAQTITALNAQLAAANAAHQVMTTALSA